MAGDLPATMTAMGFDAPGGSEVFRPETLPVPAPGPEQVLIKLAFAGVNRPDVIQRQGFYPPPPGASHIPGLEVAGEIVALGEGVDPAMLARKVCALVTGGGYAEYCLAHHGHCLPVPEGMALAEAAALPETLFTVWHNVFERGRRVEPVNVARRTISPAMLISAFAPPSTAIVTCRPSSARHWRLRGT